MRIVQMCEDRRSRQMIWIIQQGRKTDHPDWRKEHCGQNEAAGQTKHNVRGKRVRRCGFHCVHLKHLTGQSKAAATVRAPSARASGSDSASLSWDRQSQTR